jgi:hypothetical protein
MASGMPKRPTGRRPHWRKRRGIPPEQEAQWKEGTFDDWATDAFDISFREVYGEGEWARADRIGAGARASANHVRKHLAWCMIRVNIFVR